MILFSLSPPIGINGSQFFLESCLYTLLSMTDSLSFPRNHVTPNPTPEKKILHPSLSDK